MTEQKERAKAGREQRPALIGAGARDRCHDRSTWLAASAGGLRQPLVIALRMVCSISSLEGRCGGPFKGKTARRCCASANFRPIGSRNRSQQGA